MRYRPFKYGREPLWRPVNRSLRSELSPELVSWLIVTASLTRRLQQRCGGSFRVKVLEQRWRRPLFSERAVLDMADRVYALVRQVLLFCDSRPVVFARTIMPAATLNGARRRFAYLGDRPLGAMLFADRRIKRCDMEVARLDPGHALHDAAVGGGKSSAASIWGRRSVFLVEQRPLLVNEIFLPALVGPYDPVSRGR